MERAVKKFLDKVGYIEEYEWNVHRSGVIFLEMIRADQSHVMPIYQLDFMVVPPPDETCEFMMTRQQTIAARVSHISLEEALRRLAEDMTFGDGLWVELATAASNQPDFDAAWHQAQGMVFHKVVGLTLGDAVQMLFVRVPREIREDPRIKSVFFAHDWHDLLYLDIFTNGHEPATCLFVNAPLPRRNIRATLELNSPHDFGKLIQGTDIWAYIPESEDRPWCLDVKKTALINVARMMNAKSGEGTWPRQDVRFRIAACDKTAHHADFGTPRRALLGAFAEYAASHPEAFSASSSEVTYQSRLLSKILVLQIDSEWFPTEWEVSNILSARFADVPFYAASKIEVSVPPDQQVVGERATQGFLAYNTSQNMVAVILSTVSDKYRQRDVELMLRGTVNPDVRRALAPCINIAPGDMWPYCVLSEALTKLEPDQRQRMFSSLFVPSLSEKSMLHAFRAPMTNVFSAASYYELLFFRHNTALFPDLVAVAIGGMVPRPPKFPPRPTSTEAPSDMIVSYGVVARDVVLIKPDMKNEEVAWPQARICTQSLGNAIMIERSLRFGWDPTTDYISPATRTGKHVHNFLKTLHPAVTSTAPLYISPDDPALYDQLLRLNRIDPSSPKWSQPRFVY